jgi:hypothetical protein
MDPWHGPSEEDWALARRVTRSEETTYLPPGAALVGASWLIEVLTRGRELEERGEALADALRHRHDVSHSRVAVQEQRAEEALRRWDALRPHGESSGTG